MTIGMARTKQSDASYFSQYILQLLDFSKEEEVDITVRLQT